MRPGTGTDSAVESGQSALLCVAAAKIAFVTASAVNYSSYKSPGIDSRVAVVLLCVVAGKQTGLQIGHDPGTGAGSPTPDGGGSEVGGFHGTGTDGATIGGSVAIVETTSAVIVAAVNYVIDTLWLVADRKANSVVIAQTHARHDVDTVCLVTTYRDGGHIRDRLSIESALRRAGEQRSGRSLVEMIPFAGLIIDDVHDTDHVKAERILRDGVRVSAGVRGSRLDHRDIESPAVRLALHLIDRTSVGRVQRARRAVRGDAGSARRAIDIARTLRPGRRSHNRHGQNEGK